MTTKQKILRMIERLDDDVTYDRVLYHIEVMQRLEARLEQADRSEWIEHNEVFARLEEHAKSEDRLDAGRPGGLARHKTIHRKRRTSQSGNVHQTPEKQRGKAKKVS